MINFKIPSLNTVSHEWSYKEFSKESFKELLQANIKTPGEYKFNEKILNFNTEAALFKEKNYYYNKPKGTREFKNYWDRQKEFINNGMIVDDMYLHGNHYLYLNFLPINIKATQAGEFNVVTLPDFRDLDFRTFNKDELNEQNFQHSVYLKGRQLGYQQPVSTNIISPSGFKQLGDINIGDEIYTKDGSLTKVLEIFEKGVSDVYEVEFQDGRKTRCGLEHLWEVFDKKPKHKKWRTLSTQELINNLKLRDAYCNGKKYDNFRYAIPENECLQFEKKNLVVAPYLLGCLIGDGSLRSSGQVSLTSMDDEILINCLATLDDTFFYNNGENKTRVADRFTFKNINTHNVKYNLENYKDEKNVKYGYNPLSRAIELLGLKGKTTYDKFIPQDYLFGSKEQRIELLQGLMDTDGYVNAKGMDLNYTTVNKQLSEDVAFLCRSLGITINVDKKPAAKDTHKDYYRVRLSGEINFPIFKLNRKLERFNLRKNFGKSLNRFRFCNIVKITKLDYQENSRCITVDHPSHLYLTDDLIVTHNTIKFCVPLIKKLWFEENKICKIITPEERFVKKTWSDILEPFRNHLNKHTAWYRSFSPDKTLEWKQQVEIIENGRKVSKGTHSTLLGFTTKGSPTSPVSGVNHVVLVDECLLEPNLTKIVQYLIPSMKAGKYTTGFTKLVGAIGELKAAEAFKEIFFNPVANGFAGNIDIFDNTSNLIGEFIPSVWGLEGFIDRWGNADVLGATQFIMEERESKKKLSVRDYQIYVSQYPLTPQEAFQEREMNLFPTEIIQPQYEKLCRESPAIRVTLIEDHGKITHKLGSEAPPVTDLPVKKDTDKRGCVEMIEPPLYDNPPLGLYYGSCDPVTQIKTQTSDSLQSFGIYRADFYQNDVLIPGERVAWYCGRYDNVDITYEICRKLMHYYNARTMIESDKDGFIKWLINKKENLYIMKRSEYPRLQEVIPNSKIYEDYGIKKGSSKNFENHLLETIIRYVTEELSTDYDKEGNAHIRYGVERIKDKMLLKEMLDYNSRGNFDRIWEFAYQLDVAEGNTIRQRLQKIKEDKPIINNTKISISQFNNVSFKKSSLKIKQF